MKFNDLVNQDILFDSHCHLNADVYDGKREQIITNAKNSNILPVIDIGIDSKSSEKAVANANEFAGEVFACVGVDPEILIPGSDLYVKSLEEAIEDLDKVEAMLRNNKGEIIMIGESGIDLYWNKKNGLNESDFHKSFEMQKKLFIATINLASKYNLPICVHSRESVDECIEILLKNGKKVSGVFHSLTTENDDDKESFKSKISQIHELGFYISLNGIITYKSADILRDTVLEIIKEKSDLNKISPLTFYNAGFIFETDGPYLSPEGKRGELNEPANIKLVYDFLVKRLTS